MLDQNRLYYRHLKILKPKKTVIYWNDIAQWKWEEFIFALRELLTPTFGIIPVFANQEGNTHRKDSLQGSDWMRSMPYFCNREERRLGNKRGVWKWSLIPSAQKM